MTDMERGGIGGEVEETTIVTTHPLPLRLYHRWVYKKGVHACSITARRNRCILLSPKM